MKNETKIKKTVSKLKINSIFAKKELRILEKIITKI